MKKSFQKQQNSFSFFEKTDILNVERNAERGTVRRTVDSLPLGNWSASYRTGFLIV